MSKQHFFFIPFIFLCVLFSQPQIEAKVLKEKLENGFTYYIHEGQKDHHRVSLQLIVKIGSVLEEEEERGLAHFVEHMAFKGTQHFPKDQAPNLLASFGADFGNEVNAFTSFDNTRYVINLPLLKEGALDNAFYILSEWAFHMVMSDEEIEKEREVIIDEDRLRKSEIKKAKFARWQLLTKDTPYAQRHPIGLLSIIKSAPAQRIRNFYKKWYHPEHMALVVSGDVDPILAKILVKKYFSSFKSKQKSTPLPSLVTNRSAKTFFSLNTIPKLKSSIIHILFSHPFHKLSPKEEVRENLRRQFFHEIMQERLLKLQKTSPSLRFRSSSSHEILPLFFTKFYIRLPIKKTQEILKSLLLEIKRAKNQGFFKQEFDRAKDNIELKINLLENSSDPEQLQLCIDHFLGKTSLYDMEELLPLMETLSKEITPEEIKNWFKHIYEESYRIISLWSKPQGMLSEEEINELIEEVKREALQPYSDLSSPQTLMEIKPKMGKISKEEFLPKIQTVHLLLKNGMKLFFKKTQFKKGEILIQGEGKGGYKIFKGAYPKALIPIICKTMPIGKHSPLEITKILAGKHVQLKTFIRLKEKGFTLETRPEDLETAFQLLHLLFSKNEKKKEVLPPDFLQKEQETPTKHRKHLLPLLDEDMEKVSNAEEKHLLEAYTFCQKAFNTPSDFSVFIVGDFEERQVKEFIKIYLASIPINSQGK